MRQTDIEMYANFKTYFSPYRFVDLWVDGFQGWCVNGSYYTY